MTEPIVIKDFDTGIADSPHKGFGLMRNADLDSFPGALKPQKAPASIFPTAVSSTFTADAGTDVCTTPSGIVPFTDTAVTLTTTGTLPAGLATSTIYFIIKVSANTFKLATTIANAEAGTAINITDAGTGTHTVATVNPGTIRSQVRDQRTNTLFMHDSNGRVWYNSSGTARLLNGNTLTSSSGKGLAILANSGDTATYLLVFRNAVIDIINVYGTSNIETPVWSSAWQNLNSGSGSSNSHYAIMGQDGIIYFCDGRYIGSVREKPGQSFDPTNAATYTYNNQALDLPMYEIANHLEELGVNLLVAGLTFDKIYPWDRVSSSFTLPLTTPEVGVYKLKNIGNLVYVLAGLTGNIYVTQGTYVKQFRKIPEQMTNVASSILTNPITWGGIASISTGLIFGVAGQTTANNGVYLLYPDGRLTHIVTPTIGAVNVDSFNVVNDIFTLGYAGGADTIDSTYSSYQCVAQSPWYRVATKTEKATFSKLEVVIAKPSASSAAVRVSYRTNTSGSFTTLDTFIGDSSTIVFQNDAIGLIDIENIQIQIECHGVIEVVEVRLIP